MTSCGDQAGGIIATELVASSSAGIASGVAPTHQAILESKFSTRRIGMAQVSDVLASVFLYKDLAGGFCWCVVWMLTTGALMARWRMAPTGDSGARAADTIL